MAKEDRHLIYAASYLMILKDNNGIEEILLLRRANTGYMDGYYSLVAGHVDKGEFFLDAALRELEEEAGIVTEKENIIPATIINRHSSGKRDYVDAFFTVKDWQGDIENKEPEKCDELAFFSINALPEKTIAVVRRAVENYRNGIFYDELTEAI